MLLSSAAFILLILPVFLLLAPARGLVGQVFLPEIVSLRGFLNDGLLIHFHYANACKRLCVLQPDGT
jgi:hypothetical protein